MSKTKLPEPEITESTSDWGNSRYQIHPYTGKTKIKVIKGKAYKLIAFYNYSWTYPEVIEAYWKDLWSKYDDVQDSNISGEGTPNWRKEGYSGNILGLKQQLNPEELTTHIGGFWVPFAPERVVKAARRMYKAGKSAAKAHRSRPQTSLRGVR
jgi:hypothetical protein